MSNLNSSIYNPDVLSCIANLSNDEVFTSPAVANEMLDMLPPEIFESPDTKFLDPATKTGVFLREIAKRLIKGLARKIPDLQERLDHIFHEQLFGIAVTELTSLLARRSLYCSKYPNSIYSVSKFDDVTGNIRFTNLKHTWVKGKCKFCGAAQSEYDRGDFAEQHAYEFIHLDNLEELRKMKFDVIIGNPPYQLSDGGNGKSAKPIYHYFVEQAKKLNPKYLIMIIPSRWFAGGKGLVDFRNEMLNDRHIRKLVDYENFKEVFPGVDLAGGACYFLWEKNYNGPCEVVNCNLGIRIKAERYLNEYNTYIRQNLAVSIVRKIINKYNEFLDERVSSRKPFGLSTNYKPVNKGIPCWFIQRVGLKYAAEKDVDDTKQYLNKWKLLAPKAPIAGQTDFGKPVGFYYEGNTRIAKPGECCTESWIVLGAFLSEREVNNYKSYIFTKVVRFLLLQTVVSQDVTKKNYCFVPDLISYNKIYTDKDLCKLWNITEAEWLYIDSRIANTN